jgi:hypothetical protein
MVMRFVDLRQRRAQALDLVGGSAQILGYVAMFATPVGCIGTQPVNNVRLFLAHGFTSRIFCQSGRLVCTQRNVVHNKSPPQRAKCGTQCLVFNSGSSCGICMMASNALSVMAFILKLDVVADFIVATNRNLGEFAPPRLKRLRYPGVSFRPHP